MSLALFHKMSWCCWRLKHLTMCSFESVNHDDNSNEIGSGLVFASGANLLKRYITVGEIKNLQRG